MTVRVTFTIRMDLPVTMIPSQEVLGTAITRAEQLAARVLTVGDKGGTMHLSVDDNPAVAVEKTCDQLYVLPGNIKAFVVREARKVKKRAG